MTVFLHSNKFFRFFLRNNFRKEITLVIVLKLLALFGIWLLFFSHAHDHRLDEHKILHHFIHEDITS